ncbi:Permease of the drug/metabolite transporter (DMT) superfamily [Lacrimispora sphenoides]|jgi:drug/metabolite transporter (DMT)-like permease|uniref:DMT family transporter n=1 Tax=Lacrimispora sphenoides TaxID=29370 RepID=UPI0008B08245|nr:DMT family transporter [Lacrimispora sphenoides]SET47783.1 Permease of the drug/metabolite transporter (DMT) superfamily [Lacrimispora sphenoides]
MKVLEKHPMVMIAIGVIGISLSAIFVKYSDAPSVVTAAYRLLWTVGLMTPVVFGKAQVRAELKQTNGKTIALCAVSGIFLALHFTSWFESLKQTSVASSTAIVCTEVIWVALGFVVFLKGRIGKTALISIAITVIGSLLIALSDYSAGGDHLSGDGLALAAAIFSAVYTLIGREVRKGMSTISYTYIVYFFCALVLCISTAAAGIPFHGYGMSSVVVGLLLAVFSTLLGHSIFSWCLKFLSPSFVSASKLCEPVVAAIFAVFLFAELPALLQIAGGLITIGGVLLYSRVEKIGE